MKQTAPTWYAQIAPSSSREDSGVWAAEARSSSQERMKREIVGFLQELSKTGPVVLFFDDLHWADVSTVDAISFLAGKLDLLNVLLVVTYRPSDMLLAQASVPADQAGSPGAWRLPRDRARLSEPGRCCGVPRAGVSRPSLSAGVPAADSREDGRQPVVRRGSRALPPRSRRVDAVERRMDARRDVAVDRT